LTDRRHAVKLPGAFHENETTFHSARSISFLKEGISMLSTRKLRVAAGLAVSALVAVVAVSTGATATNQSTKVVIWADADRVPAVTQVANAWARAKGVTVEVVQKQQGPIRQELPTVAVDDDFGYAVELVTTRECICYSHWHRVTAAVGVPPLASVVAGTRIEALEAHVLAVGAKAGQVIDAQCWRGGGVAILLMRAELGMPHRQPGRLA